jgi:hypothetical protein
MPCIEKGRLLLEYQLAVSKWSHITERSPEDSNFSQRANVLRLLALAAKSACETHQAEHGC